MRAQKQGIEADSDHVDDFKVNGDQLTKHLYDRIVSGLQKNTLS